MNDVLDIQVVEETEDPENEQMHLFAKLAAVRLGEHYPRHLWAVGWHPGMALCIKNMGVGGDGFKYGFTIDVPKCHSISHFERLVVMGGGELLERCGAPRGAWDGQFMELQDKTEDR